jgi:hypothetical protein
MDVMEARYTFYVLEQGVLATTKTHHGIKIINTKSNLLQYELPGNTPHMGHLMAALVV